MKFIVSMKEKHEQEKPDELLDEIAEILGPSFKSKDIITIAEESGYDLGEVRKARACLEEEILV